MRTMTVNQAAAQLGLDGRTLYRAIHRGELEVVPSGGRWWVNQGALDQYVEGSRIVPGSQLKLTARCLPLMASLHRMRLHLESAWRGAFGL